MWGEAIKPKALSVVGAALCLCGCQTYSYRIVQPPATPAVVSQQPVTLRREPLEYRFSEQQGHLGIRIANLTSDPIMLLGDRSYVTDPEGESHPIGGRAIGPHSYIRMLLPPIPFTFSHPDYTWGWGWGGWPWGWNWPGYVPMTGPYYGEGFIGPPPLVYEHVLTVYDWRWKRGPVHLRLTYAQGKETFQHDFELDRQPEK